MRLITRLLAAALVAALLAPIPVQAARIVKIRGGGYGHGLGMSQYGSLGRAKRGDSPVEILTHYYSGTTVAARNMPTAIRVGLLQTQTVIELKSQSAGSDGGRIEFRIADNEDPFVAGSAGSNWRIEVGPTGGYRVYKNGNRIKRDGRAVFGGPSRPLIATYQEFNTRVLVIDKGLAYRYGKLVFGTYRSSSCDPGFCMRLNNAVGMQGYLYGLGEVPSSWPWQALQTQAIAARTYAFNKVLRLGQHRIGCDCAVYDSVADQAYVGDRKRLDSGPWWPDWKGAVDATKDKVVLHNGFPIEAYYSSSSGGHTENNEFVWGGSPIPYLRGVPDAPDAVADNPNHVWDPITMSWASFSARLNAYYGTGTLKKFEVIKRGVSGRVTDYNESNGTGGARIVGSARTVRTSGWSLRSALGLKDSLFYVDILFVIGERFRALYDRLNGAPGEATGAPYNVPRGWANPLGTAQNFTTGRMTWRKATNKVVWQWGPVLDRYDAFGREKSPYGMPTTGIWGPGSYRGASYVEGSILWSQATGAHGVLATFRRAFQRVGGATGHLRLPIAEKQKHADLPSGRRQRFQRGTLYRTPGMKVWALWGAIDSKYRGIDAATSACGYPTADQTGNDLSGTASFQHGTMTWAAGAPVQVDCG
jgi:SpoIID/LytB domain protein